MLITFNNRPYLVSSLTSNYENLLDRLLFVKSGGRNFFAGRDLSGPC